MVSRSRPAWMRHGPFFLFLALHAGLLFTGLDLLPVWGDEQFTLDVIQRPWAEILPILQNDIHPPVYYLLACSWAQLPWPGTLIEQTRAFSALVAMVSTILLYGLWLRRESAGFRFWFQALWTLSPTLLLYSRMARSYSLQLLAGILAVAAAVAFLREPGKRRWLAAYAAAAVSLLYVHYLPGLAVTGATALVLAVRSAREKNFSSVKYGLAANLIIGTLYLPWLATLIHALRRVSEAEPYFLVQNFALETVVKLAYWFTSFTFGESFPAWAIVAGVLLAPPVVWLLWKALQPPPPWWPLVAFAALIAYCGATAWVSFPFVGARLLFLLPFYLLWVVRGWQLSPRPGTVILSGLLVISLGAVSSYFHKEGFLNQGYLVPFGEIAGLIESQSPRANSLVLVDGYNTDPSPLLAQLPRRDVVKIRGGEAEQQARERIQTAQAATVWFLRNTHDISPGTVVSKLENELAEGFDSQRYLYVPYSPADRFAAQVLGWPREPGFHYQLTRFERRPRSKPSSGDRVRDSPGR